MKKLLLLINLAVLLFLFRSYAQTVAPLQLGNIWVYNHFTHTSKTTVVDTNIVIDTISYYKLESVSNYSGTEWQSYVRLKEDSFYAERVDTTYPAPNHEQLYYKKGAVIGDTWQNPAPHFPMIYTVLDTVVSSVFGITATIKHLEMDGSLVLLNEYWTEEFGLLDRGDFSGPLESLKGCVIDGTVYGDTSFTIVSVDDEFAIPRDFCLKQNYPNPFNPTTTISYSIQKDGLVTLKVFDILGNEVANLVSDRMAAGNYSVSFNAANLPSGIYVYQLTSGYFTVSKKLILLK